MKLEKQNLLITDFCEDDIQAKVSIINDSLNNTFLHYDIPIEYSKTLNWYKNKNTTNRLDCTIKYDNEVCGFIGLLNIDTTNKKAEYYICVDHHFSGKGIGKNASNLLLEYAFNTLNINKVYLYTEVDNLKAQHLFEKIGFHNEGLLKDDIYYKNKMISRYAYGIWKSDIIQ